MCVYRFCNVAPGWVASVDGQADGIRRPDSGPEAGRHEKDGTTTMTSDHDHHDVIVEDRGSGVGAILGVIVILALLVGFWYFAFGPGQGTFGGSTSNSGTDINVNVDLPSGEPASS
jgi:hypothetical protein